MNQNIEDELFKSYLGTEYVVKNAAVNMIIRIGEKNSDLDNLFSNTGECTAAFLTAYNPYSKPLSLEENKGRQAELLVLLEKENYKIFRGYGKGKDESWQSEPSFLVLGIDYQRALALARRFEQNAFVYLEKGKAPELIISR